MVCATYSNWVHKAAVKNVRSRLDEMGYPLAVSNGKFNGATKPP